METSFHLDGTIFPVFPTAGNTFENPSPRPAIFFLREKKDFLFPGENLFLFPGFRIIKFKIEKGETQFV